LMLTKQKNLSINYPNNRLEQTAGTSRFDEKVCINPLQYRAAAQAGR